MSPVSLETAFPEFSAFLIDPLTNFFGEARFETLEVLRKGGRARAAIVLQADDQFYVIELALSNPQSGEAHVYFDRARYRLTRLKFLKKLGRHYPETYFLRADGPWTQEGPQQLVIVLQEFIPFPVCDFTEYDAVLELLKILRLCANLGMLLDYNQNHWLYKSSNNGSGHLYYVDRDYIDDGRSFENAVRVGFDQCTIYLTLQNAPHFARALVLLAKEDVKAHLGFVGIIRDQIRQNLESLQDRDRTQGVQDRIKSFELILGQT
ncbi:MAG: hypothetical protein ACXACI_02435 [Candidatus Hodarchaeales archaeon]